MKSLKKASRWNSLTGLVNNLQMALDTSSSFSWERLMSTTAKPLRASCKQANEHDWAREGTADSPREQTWTDWTHRVNISQPHKHSFIDWNSAENLHLRRKLFQSHLWLRSQLKRKRRSTRIPVTSLVPLVLTYKVCFPNNFMLLKRWKGLGDLHHCLI